MTYQRLLAMVMMLVLFVSGCRQQNTTAPEDLDLNIDMQVEPAEPVVGDAQLVISITDGEGNPVNDAALNVRGDMDHAGMTPVLAEIEGGTDGVYTVPFEWTMAGDWIVEVIVDLGDDQTVTETFNLTVAGDMEATEEMDMDSSG